MTLREALLALQEFWTAQTQLELLTIERTRTLLKINSDNKRTTEEKELAKKALQAKYDRSTQTLSLAKDQLLTETNKDRKKIIDELLGLSLPNTTRHKPKEANDFKSFDLNVYRQLHPLAELAYSYEPIGSPSLHSSKLASIFESKQQALAYLNEYANEHSTCENIMHDACSFPFPTTINAESRWLTLARQERGKNLFNPHFRTLLTYSKAIEEQINKDQLSKDTLIAQVMTKYENNVYVMHIINKNIKTRKIFCDKYTAGQLPEERDGENSKQNKKFLAELEVLYNDRAILHLKKSFDQYTLQDISDSFKRLTQNTPSKKLFVKAGIDDTSYERFLMLDRSKAGKNIPDILLDCKNGYYIKKLQVQNDYEAGLAATLGDYTDCCQNMSGETGEPCVIHGLTNEDSGFYVLFKGDAKDADIVHDEIYGQTWVNRTRSGMLLFDSIESKQAIESNSIKPIVIAAFQQLANTLIKLPDVPKVQCGDNSGISDEAAIEDPYLVPEPPKNYHEYRYSHYQLFLAEKNSPFVLTNNKLTLSNEIWNAEVEKCDSNRSITDKMRFYICWVIANKKLDILPKKIDSTIVSKYLQDTIAFEKELYAYKDYNIRPAHLKNIEPLLLIRDSNNVLSIAITRKDIEFVEDILRNKADPNLRNTVHGKTPLMCAAFYKQETIVDLLLDAKADVNLRDYHYGDTALTTAARIGHEEIVKILIEANADLDIKNDAGMNALESAKYYMHDSVALLIEEAMDIKKLQKYTIKRPHTPSMWQLAAEAQKNEEAPRRFPRPRE